MTILVAPKDAFKEENIWCSGAQVTLMSRDTKHCLYLFTSGDFGVEVERPRFRQQEGRDLA